MLRVPAPLQAHRAAATEQPFYAANAPAPLAPEQSFVTAAVAPKQLAIGPASIPAAAPQPPQHDSALSQPKAPQGLSESSASVSAVASERPSNTTAPVPADPRAPLAPQPPASTLAAAAPNPAPVPPPKTPADIPAAVSRPEMPLDVVPDRVIDAVQAPLQPSESAPSADDTAPPPPAAFPDADFGGRFTRMLRSGVPAGAVRQKMMVRLDEQGPPCALTLQLYSRPFSQLEGVPESVAEAVLSPQQPGGSAAAPAAAVALAVPAVLPDADFDGRFTRMLRTGVPEGAVRQKMMVSSVGRRHTSGAHTRFLPRPYYPPSLARRRPRWRRRGCPVTAADGWIPAAAGAGT